MLFCCDYNSVRSPMAEGIFKKLIDRKIFVQSAGIFDTLEVDGFTVKVCNEINVKLSKHRVRSIREMEKGGGFIGSFDLIITLTKVSLAEAKRYSNYSSVAIEGWAVDEPKKYESDIVYRIVFFYKLYLRFITLITFCFSQPGLLLKK